MRILIWSYHFRWQGQGQRYVVVDVLSEPSKSILLAYRRGLLYDR